MLRKISIKIVIVQYYIKEGRRLPSLFSCWTDLTQSPVWGVTQDPGENIRCLWHTPGPWHCTPLPPSLVPCPLCPVTWSHTDRYVPLITNQIWFWNLSEKVSAAAGVIVTTTGDMSLFGPNSVFNINRGSGPLGYGVVHPVASQHLKLYSVDILFSDYFLEKYNFLKI